MPKGSAERTNARREEIISACAQLCQTVSFNAVTLKDIAGATSFTRTSIYNYFQTREEIFLALLQREFERWAAALDDMAASCAAMSVGAFSGALAHTLEERGMLLKLLSMNHFDMEENSRPECLREFKKAYGDAVEALGHCLAKFFPGMDAKARQGFLCAFLPFLYGLYPCTTVSDKQRLAMAEAGQDYACMSVCDMAFNCVSALLRGYGGEAKT